MGKRKTMGEVNIIKKLKTPRKKSIPKKKMESGTQDEIQTPERDQKLISDWSDDLTKSLISWYELHELMWKKTHHEYLNRDKKIECLKRWVVLENLQPVEPDDNSENGEKEYNALLFKYAIEAENKFHSLRVSMNRELKNLPNWRSGAGVDDINDTDSTWKFFKDIFFLRRDITTRQTMSNMDMPSDSEETHQSSCTFESAETNAREPMNVDEDEEIQANTNSQLPSTSTAITIGSKIVRRPQSQVPPPPPPPPAPRGPKGNRSTALEEQKLEVMKKFCNVLEGKKDGVDRFCQYCAETLRKMPEQQQKDTIMKITQLLLA